MTYHGNKLCATCGGLLESDRDSVCHACVPQSWWFNMVANLEALAAKEDARIDE